MADYYLKYNDRVSGPFPIDTLKNMARDGLVTTLHNISADRENWLPAEQLPGLFDPAVSVATSHSPPATPTIPITDASLPEAPSTPMPVPLIDSPVPAPLPSPASGGSMIPPHAIFPPSPSAVGAPPPSAPNPVMSFFRDIMKGGRINLKITSIACLIAVAMSLVLGVTTLVVDSRRDQVIKQVKGDYYDYHPMGGAKAQWDAEEVANSYKVRGVIAGIQSLTILAFMVFWLIAFYQCWKTVEPLRLRDPSIPSPGTAIGFLFIPIYGFYWIFACLTGLGKHLNALNRLHHPERNDNTLIHGLGIAVGVSSVVVTLALATSADSPQASLIQVAVLLLYLGYIKAVVDVANQIPGQQ